jgi:AGZA family xanthine/uracil permease-like MFS transporter
VLGGIVLGSIGVFIIERQLRRAAAFALAGAVFTFFGLIHGEAIGIARSPEVAFAYLAVAAVLFLNARSTVALPAVVTETAAAE